MKVDFDLVMAVVAYNLYRMLATDLPPGRRQLTARTLLEHPLPTGASVHFLSDTRTVELKKIRHLPALLEALHAQDPVKIPCLGDRQILFRSATRS